MAQPTDRIYRTFQGNSITELPVKGSTIIYGGSAIGISSGYARQLVSGDVFAGFAESTVDNRSGADGAKKIQTRLQGEVELAVTSVAVTNIFNDVFASDGATFNLVGGSFVGKVMRFASAGVAMVSFDLRNP